MGEEGGHRQATLVTNIGPTVDGGHRPATLVTNIGPTVDLSFLDLVRQTVSRKGSDDFATWYDGHGKATNEYTFEGMWEEAGVIAYYLRNKWKLKKGDRVVLCYNFGLHFFASFLGCLRAGVVAVLVYPPIEPLIQSLPKMNKVVADCDAELILIDSVIALGKRADKWNPLSKSRKQWPDDSVFKVTDKLAQRLHDVNGVLEFDEMTSPDDLAFLQYTSGSTGDPKGVMVTFAALNAQVEMLHLFVHQDYEETGGVRKEIVGLSWLPQYHDMGLIYAIVAPFAAGWRMHMMSPFDFVRNPLLWLDLMSRHKVCWSIAPDFAYCLASRKFIEARDGGGGNPLPGLDLSSIHYLLSAAEPIRVETRKKFGDLFSEYGLPHRWFAAGYGLAENVVACSYLHDFRLSHLEASGMFPKVAVGSRKTFSPSQVHKIVSETTHQELPDGEIGELWVSGPSVAAGYFGKPKLSEEVFRARIAGSGQTFLRTGDLAFFQDDFLYICGRLKDLIIINGVNYYPQDVEDEVQNASSAVRPGCVAAFSSSDNGDGDEGLEIVYELRKASQKDVANVTDKVRRRVISNIGLLPARIVAIKERTIPKTTSGKIRRRATRSSLYEGGLKVVFDWTASEEVTEDEFSTTSFGVLDANEEEDELTTRKVVQKEIIANGESELNACESSSCRQGIDGMSSAVQIGPDAGYDGQSSSKKVDLVRRTVASILGLPPDEINVNRPIYEIGLTSIIVIQLAEALSKATGESVPMSIFYEDCATLERIAIQHGMSDSESTNLSLQVPIATDSKSRHDAFPLNAIQTAYYMGWQLSSVATHSYQVLHFKNIDLNRFEHAWNEVVMRHDMLRCIVKPNGESQQVLERVPYFVIPVFEDENTRKRVLGWEDDSHHTMDPHSYPCAWHISAVKTGTAVRLHVHFYLLFVDFLSLSIMLEEVEKLYHEEQLPPPPRALFRDACVYHANRPPTEDDKMFWKARLPSLGYPPVIPERKNASGVPFFLRVTGTVDGSTAHAIADLAAAQGVPPSIIYLEAFARAIELMAEDPTFTIVVTVVDRPVGYNDVVGDFTGLALYTSRPGSLEARWRDAFDQVSYVFAKPSVDGVRLQRMLRQHHNDPQLQFPVVFTSTIGINAGLSAPLGGEVLTSITQTPQVLLDLQLYNSPDHGVGWNLDYDSSRLDKSVVSCIGENFEMILRSPRVEVEPIQFPPSSVLEIGLSTPHRVAVVDPAEGVRLRYDQLLHEARRFSEQLEIGERVGIVLRKGWRQAVAVIGSALAGAVYVPLNPSWPVHRIEKMLELADVACTVLDAVHRCRPRGREVVLERDQSPSNMKIPNQCSIDPNSPAYIIFTSGSTGTPKGVVISYDAFANTVHSINQRYNVGPDDRTYAHSSLSFDLSVYDLWGPLCVGGSVVFCGPDDTNDPDRWWRNIEDHGVTIWNTVPVVFEFLWDHRQRQVMKPLRVVLVSGDWCPVRLASEVRDSWPECMMGVLGGATECSIWSIVHDVVEVDAEWTSIPYGRALPGQIIEVVDSKGRRRLPGVPGEIVIGGRGVAIGYWQEKKLTTDRFVTHPVLGRIYRTGDMGRYAENGEIEFLGRSDHQVKIRGHRVELGEIEAIIEGVPPISTSVAIVRSQRIIAYVVCMPSDDEELGTQQSEDKWSHLDRELKQHMERQLPEYMHPSMYVHLEKLPLSANGKVDIKALPIPEMTNEEYVAPTSSHEAAMCDLWSELLQVDLVGINDDWFALGGNSLLAMQLSQRTGYSVQTIFKSRTVRQLVQAVQTLETAPITNSINRSSQVLNVTELRQSPLFRKRLELCQKDDLVRSNNLENIEQHFYPLTRVQQRTLLAHEMDPDIGVYNVSTVVKLREEVCIRQLEVAFQALMKLHPVLCTRYIGDAAMSEPTIGFVDMDLAVGFSITFFEMATLEDANLARIIQEPFNLRKEASLRVYFVPKMRELVIVSHHIAMDHGSTPALVHHLSELYQNPSWTPHEKGGLDYIDYSWREFEREVKGDPYDYLFWTNHLCLDGGRESLPQLELTEDPERNHKAPYTRAVKAAVDLTNSSIHKSVIELSRLHSVTPFMIYLCVFEVVVKCFVGQNDIIIGILVNLRPETHTHALGMFVNTIALRLQEYNANSTGKPQEQDHQEALFCDLLQRRSSLWNSALERADVPFDMVASHAKGHKGIYQASFNYLNDLEIGDDPEMGPSTMFSKSESMGQSDSLSSCDLEFSVEKSGVSVKARERIWSQAMLQRFLDCYVEFLTNVTRNSLDTPCTKLSLLPKSQINILNSALIGHPKVWEHQPRMHQFFERTVDDKPNNVALRMMDKKMTYQQVEDRSNQFARFLLDDCGVKVEDRVGILLPRGFEQIIALLAILKAGCAYVPLDDTYPELRIAAIIEDSGMVACITTDQNGLSHSVQDCEVVAINSPRLHDMSTSRPDEVKIYHDNLCYVLYTSGSTGTPKGVEVEHRSVCNLGLHLLSMYSNFECTEDNFLLVSRLTWDTSVANIVFTFGSGGTLCLVPPELSGSLTLNLSILFSEMNITRSDVAPGLFKYLDAENQKSLREIMTGGDVVLPNALKQVVSERVNVRNEYGPTEATVMVTQHLVTGSDPCFHVGRSVSIGRPIPNVRLYVLDRYLNQVPVGVVGELYISGACLARGYTSAEETSAAFVENPFAEQCSKDLPTGVDSSRLYRTGDLVRVLADGLLDFVGRVQSGSSYIKLRGYRIEPREISLVLESHEFVDHAVVLVDEPRQQLVAFAASSRLEGEEDLLELCRSRLVNYAVPSKIIVLDVMPLDPNGKIDRKALAASIPQTYNEEEVVIPANEVEELLVKVFALVLGLSEETVSVTADVFNTYGANSLTVAQFVSETRRLDCVGDFSVRDVYESLSLRQLALQISDPTVGRGNVSRLPQPDSSSLVNLSACAPNVTELRHSAPFLERLALCHRQRSVMSVIDLEEIDLNDERLYPLTRVQQRMLLAQSMDPNVGVYNVPAVVKLKKEASVEQLEMAFQALMRLHPVLCTRYICDPALSEPSIGLVDLQLADEFSITVLDEAPLSETRLSQIAQEPFNLQTEASVRVHYDPGTHDLVMVFHHIAMDGGSMPVLAHHLSELYKDSGWTPLESSGWDYIDYAWREFQRESEGIPCDLSFWTDHLGLDGGGEPLPVMELPEDPQRSRNVAFTQAVEASVDLTDTSSNESVVELSRMHGVTPFAVHLSVFEVVLKSFTGQNDLALGVTVNVRPGSYSHALGMFVNMIALRLRNSNVDSCEAQQQGQKSEQEMFSDLMQRRWSLWNSALEHADVPFDMVASKNHGHRGVFQAAFNYMIDLEIGEGIERTPSTPFSMNPGNTVQSGSLAKFDLEFTMTKSNMSMKARERIWSQAMLQRFLDCYLELLNSVTQNPSLDAPCRKLRLLPKHQTNLLNDALIGCPKVWEHQLLMHQFFERTVDDKPNNVALRMMNKTMTYQEVEDRANQCARYLLEDCGVKLEDRVGILLPRGFDQIFALLAILKAGCAYVPLDDTYPQLRIASIIEDSRMVACITTKKNGLFRCVRDCVALTIENPRLDDMSTKRPSGIEITPDNLCYVLYTSGSTGTPKGVKWSIDQFAILASIF